MLLWAQRWLTYGSDWQVCVSVLVCMCVNMCECNGFRGHKETHLDSSSPSPTPSSIRAANSLCLQLTLTPFHSVLPNITQTPDSIKDPPRLLWIDRASQTSASLSLRWVVWSQGLGEALNNPPQCSLTPRPLYASNVERAMKTWIIICVSCIIFQTNGS